ncbi:MAG: penicillin-binding protein 1A [Acidobacteriaceae bacterium]
MSTTDKPAPPFQGVAGSRVPGGGFRPPVHPRSAPGRKKIAGSVALLVLLVLAVAGGALAGLLLVYSVDLPQIADLERYRPLATTELYDVHGRPFGSFALERRTVVAYSAFSPVLRQAILSIEDKNFESHWGINLFRVAGAAYHDLTSPSRAQGASTLTMQLARNLFLSSNRTFTRKLQEIFLSIQIEHACTKQQIFTLYANQIYLGHGVFGFEAGSAFYFSKPASELTLPEAALLAGLPKGPVAYSPILNPDKAFRRRNTVLNSMLEDGVITAAQASAAKSAPLGLHLAPPPNSIAPWFVEEVRRELERKFGAEQVHAAGLKVYTTLDLGLQQTANRAVLDGLAAYERRHGWKGHLLNILAAGQSLETFRHPDWSVSPAPGDYFHALVIGVLPDRVTLRVGSQRMVLESADWAWVGDRTGEKSANFLRVGDLVYVRRADANADLSAGDSETSEVPDLLLRGTLEQDSGAEGALMAVDNASGDILTMVGGRDFNLSQFNRATQARRQTGSSFKPYVYAAAVEKGATPGEMILDTPATFATPGGPYTPHDYESNYLGRISLLKAFADSRNIPAVRLAERVGMHSVIDAAHRFGISGNIPSYLPVALGSVEATLSEQVAAYSSFPNDGIRITPHLVRKVTNADGMLLWENAAYVHESTSTRTARTMMVFLKEVTHSGTAFAAAALHHPRGGKTGTTSDYTDAWFVGFSPSVTCGVWVGYDNRQSLGDKETGAHAALPIWMTFMQAAIAGKEDEQFPGDFHPSPTR